MSQRPTTRRELLDANATAMAALEVLIARYPANAFVTMHDAAGWTGKDHLAHLAAWLRGGFLPVTEGLSRWDAVGLSKALYEARDEEDYHRANEVIRAQHVGDTLKMVLRVLRDTVKGSQEFLRTASDDELFRPLEPCASDPGLTSAFTLLDIDGWNHFDEHREYIARLLGDR